MTLLQFVKYLRRSGQKGMVYLDTVGDDPIIEFGTCVFPSMTEYCEGIERKHVIITSVVNTSGFVNYYITLDKRESLIDKILSKFKL